MQQSVNIFWFRRDLRLDDNAGLYFALRGNNPVIPIFIFDRNILDDLEDKADKRIVFIYRALESLQQQLARLKSSVRIYFGYPEEIFKELFLHYTIEKVYTNHDYEPYAISRDEIIKKLVEKSGASFHTHKDQVIFEKNEILKDDGKPYTIFTPYSRRWKNALDAFYTASYPTEKYFSNFYPQPQMQLPSFAAIGFEDIGSSFPSKQVRAERLKQYGEKRDFPGENGTTMVGVHLRFGTLSIRKLAAEAVKTSESYLNELIWRDFYHMILWHFPQVGKGKGFKPEYDFIRWRNNEAEFKTWCEGMTGYPMVDAGMRQLNETGYMHNRVRMVAASFLAKHLLINWRWGEEYFARKLLDFDLAANNGGWQWAAGSGCDAAPYFRVFNPALQAQKFDPQFNYIRSWVPEFQNSSYPQPMVDHEFARKRALKVYADALKKS